MKKKISMGSGVDLDVGTLLDTRLLVTGNSGCGKSWTLRLIAEQVAARVPTLVIDPEGEYPSLREKIDAVLVSDEGDVKPHPKLASKLARRLLELRVSAVADIQSLKLRDRRAFVRYFLEGLMSAPRRLWRPTFVLVDEVHRFAPERSAGQSEATEAVITLMSQGRKRGFAGILATTRLSRLHKDAAADAVNNLVGRTTLDVDVSRALDVLGLPRSGKKSLRKLKPGEWFGDGPAFRPQTDGLARFQTAKVKTTHPRSGQRHLVRVPAPSAKIKRVVSELEDLPKEAEQEARDFAEAQDEVKRLKRELRTANKAQPPGLSKVDRKGIEMAGFDRGVAEATVVFERQLLSVKRDFTSKLGGHPAALTSAAAAVRQVIDFCEHPDFAEAPQLPSARRSARSPAPAPTPAGTRAPAAAPASGANGRLVPARQRILDGLAWLEAIGFKSTDRSPLAYLANTTPSSSSYGNNLGAMRSAGLVDYPSSRRVCLTDAGREQANSTDTPLASEDLHRMVYAKLAPARVRILKPLVEVYPDALDRDDLAGRAGVSPSSSSYGNNLGAMRSAGFIDYPSARRVAASKILFLNR